MTKKRFIKGYHIIRDTEENKAYDFRVDIICDLLNDLYEKNLKLEKRNKKLVDLLQFYMELSLLRRI